MTTAQALDAILSRLDEPLVLIDAGARWGAPKQWEAIARHATILCFEPDPDETDRLNAQAPPNVTYVPMALGAPGRSSATLHVSQQPACSSVYAPLVKLYEDYPALAEIRPVRAVEIATRELDAVLIERGIGGFDAIKLDTQGSELDILRGARKALSTCALIDVEVEFNPIYEGQNLFCDVDRFLRDYGFALWRISEICHYAPDEDKAPPVNFMMAFSPPQTVDNMPVRGGQIFWGQAQYVRAVYPRTGLAQLPKRSGLRAAAVIANAGYWDLALEILAKCDNAFAAEIHQLLA
jgi:FkbM family methyltransferase